MQQQQSSSPVGAKTNFVITTSSSSCHMMYPKVNRHGVQHQQDQGQSGLKYPMNNPQGVQFQETNSSKKGTSQLEDFKI